MNKTISIKDSFGRFTGLRHSAVSEKSGEEFYHSVLNNEFKKCFETKTVLTVDLDGVRGYSPSFIDEAFGNLVYDFGLQNVERYLVIKSNDKPFWKETIEKDTYKLWEQRRKNKQSPKKTIEHSAWWSYSDNKFIEHYGNF
ncbi:STAS-like domain-containing protein [Chryseobacterium mucoviscidosis]|uniref:STAS-like domain-containing protein n=1 Tax=Chryseobacterium mucoviscidosis TaxID=1945581 RepID=UPI0031E1BAD7